MLISTTIALTFCATATSGATIAKKVFGPITVSNTPPQTASQVIKDAFVSFAIELSQFPAFAGNNATPNTFSDNLLNNIGAYAGVKPYIRVGGNAADRAIYDPNQQTAVVDCSPQPCTIHIGSSFFESYNTWPGAKFSHGFNLGQISDPGGWTTLLDTVPLACNALRGKLVAWEYGNEPDLYTNNGLRSTPYTGSQYVSEWENGTSQIERSLRDACPDLTTPSAYGYIGLSFWGTGALNPTAVWNSLGKLGTVKMVAFHNYMSGPGTNGNPTLQGLLLNHTHTVNSVQGRLQTYQSIINSGASIIVGEVNSIFNTGVAGISDVFGAALWVVDYHLWCASQSITRVHMQQGLNFIYNAWQPIDTKVMAKGTKAPYYGSIASAAMIGNTLNGSIQIINIPLNSATDAAYGAYINGKLARIAILNMREYNSAGGQPGRPSQTYNFSVPGTSSMQATIRSLLANGSDVLSGITFDGYSYDYNLNQGKPVLVSGVPRGTTVPISSGKVSVQVMDSSAVILDFN